MSEWSHGREWRQHMVQSICQHRVPGALDPIARELPVPPVPEKRKLPRIKQSMHDDIQNPWKYNPTAGHRDYHVPVCNKVMSGSDETSSEQRDRVNQRHIGGCRLSVYGSC
jgi:hypothetical protein